MFTFKKFEDGAYYRDAALATNKNINLNLADIPLPNGILRIDRMIGTDSIELRLGHYALPQLKSAIKKKSRKVKGYKVQIIDNGEYQLAMIPVSGWENMISVNTKGVHPVSEESSVINVEDTYIPLSNKHVIYATLMLWKKSGEKWRDEELVPVKSIKTSITASSVAVSFRDGSSKTVKFE